MFLLGKHPEAMARLEAELDAAGLPVTPQRPQPRALTYADISKLPWLDACVKVWPASLLADTGAADHAKSKIGYSYAASL